MFGRFWSFLRRKQNREILGWLGGGAVVAAGGLWVLVTWLFPEPSPTTEPSTSSAEGGLGSTNIGRDNLGTINQTAPTPQSK